MGSIITEIMEIDNKGKIIWTFLQTTFGQSHLWYLAGGILCVKNKRKEQFQLGGKNMVLKRAAVLILLCFQGDWIHNTFSAFIYFFYLLSFLEGLTFVTSAFVFPTN